MKEARFDLWERYDAGAWVCITTNGIVRRGRAVMGRGTAFQAAQRFSELPYMLGKALRVGGNHVHVFVGLRIITFPVKHHWADQADLGLIARSAQELALLERERPVPTPIYLPRPGCGNGRLEWVMVKPILAEVLPDTVVVIDRP